MPDLKALLTHEDTDEAEALPQEKPKRTRKPASDKLRREATAKVKLGLTELQPLSMLTLGPLGLTSGEIDDIARVAGKLAVRHPVVASVIDRGEEASVYGDLALVAGKLVVRRHALIHGFDITNDSGDIDPMATLAYVTYLREQRGETAAPSETAPNGVEQPDNQYAESFIPAL